MEKNLEQTSVIDKRYAKLENVLKPDYIPFLSGRPIRQTIINAEDVMNLNILLNTTNSVEEFLARI